MSIVLKKWWQLRMFWYSVIIIVFLSIFSLLQNLSVPDADVHFYLACALVLVMGIIHARSLSVFLYNRTATASAGRGWLITVLLPAAAALISAALCYILKQDYRFLFFLLVFPLPYLLLQVYYLFVRIPARQYALWYYPLDEQIPDLDMIDLSQIQVVQFVFRKHGEDANDTNFTSKAPLHMQLGQLFFIFINDYNEKNEANPVVYVTETGQPDRWLFYRKKKWMGNVYFDPALTFRENGIAPNEFIYAVRM